MYFYIFIFFILLLIVLYFMKINEDKMKEVEDNKKYIDRDYQLILIVFSIIIILLIIYFKILLSDIFIRFINKYTNLGKYLQKIKDYMVINKKTELTYDNIKEMKGGCPDYNDYIVNNDLPLSDYSEISSIEF